MHTLDLTPLNRSSIGFDRFNRMLEATMRAQDDGSFPPYNIEKSGEDRYRISMAVAGYSQDELDVTAKENSLVISGKSGADDREATFLHRGIARRSFVRRFELADTVRVTGANLENGLLHIDLINEIPAAKKPRRIEIGSGKAEQIEAKAA